MLILILTIAAVFFMGALVQSVAGFAFTLFAVPLLMLWGFPVEEAVALTLGGSVVQRCALAWQCRQSLVWRPMMRMLPLCLVGLALGVLGLIYLSMVSAVAVRQFLGVLILTTLVAFLLFKKKTLGSPSAAGDQSAAFLSGFLTGLVNAGGPPLVLWVMVQDWSKDRLRATISAFTLLLVPVQLALLAWAFGPAILSLVGKAALLAPAAVAGTTVGSWLSGRMNADHLRFVMRLLLGLTGVIYLIEPWLRFG
jgi:uncharacterized membrane protein YfcA